MVGCVKGGAALAVQASQEVQGGVGPTGRYAIGRTALCVSAGGQALCAQRTQHRLLLAVSEKGLHEATALMSPNPPTVLLCSRHMEWVQMVHD